MSLLYDKKYNPDFYNISIDGYDLIAEEITPNEGYNRRETGRHGIIGGTQAVVRTNYIPRDYTFTTHLLIDPSYPDVYNKILQEWQSKAVEVVSRYMGGKFFAECIIKPDYNESPNYLKLEIQLIEIPDTTSLIPNDVFKPPTNNDKRITVTSTKKKKTSNKKKSGKSKKESKSNKNKGKNITKTNKKNK